MNKLIILFYFASIASTSYDDDDEGVKLPTLSQAAVDELYLSKIKESFSSSLILKLLN